MKKIEYGWTTKDMHHVEDSSIWVADSSPTVYSKPHQDFLSYCYSAEEDTVVLMGNGNHENVNTIETVKVIAVDNQRKTQGSINLPDTMYIKNLFGVTKIMNSG
jgi:4-hydroxy-3-methylbut-2-enyl diphosphate reductase IspH